MGKRNGVAPMQIPVTKNTEIDESQQSDDYLSEEEY